MLKKLVKKPVPRASVYYALQSALLVVPMILGFALRPYMKQ